MAKKSIKGRRRGERPGRRIELPPPVSALAAPAALNAAAAYSEDELLSMMASQVAFTANTPLDTELKLAYIVYPWHRRAALAKITMWLNRT